MGMPVKYQFNALVLDDTGQSFCIDQTFAPLDAPGRCRMVDEHDPTQTGFAGLPEQGSELVELRLANTPNRQKRWGSEH